MARQRPESSSKASLEGSAIGGVTVGELCARGSFGDVYRGRDAAGAAIAFKVLHPEREPSPSLVRRFALEVESLQRLDHPGIVGLRGAGTLEDGRPYLIMDWVDGPTLADELERRGALPAAGALSYLGDLAAALDAAHRIGVIHRDVKPSNVLLAGEPARAVLVDFGLAKLLLPDPALGLTTAGAVLGTPLTMAPEQILGEPVDPRADVYALAVIAYRMLAGAYPFTADTALELQELHVNGDIPALDAACDAPPAAGDVLRRALAKQADERPGDAPTFVRQLGAALEATP